IHASNNGPDAATNTIVSDTISPDTTFVGISQPAGWTCNPFSGGTVTCTIPALTGTPPSSSTFTLTVTVPSSAISGTVLVNTVSITSSAVVDTNSYNNAAT